MSAIRTPSEPPAILIDEANDQSLLLNELLAALAGEAWRIDWPPHFEPGRLSVDSVRKWVVEQVPIAVAAWCQRNRISR